MAADGELADLRRLRDWFSTSPQRGSLHIERIALRLGTTAVPLLGRELRTEDPRRRAAARTALSTIAGDGEAARLRVIAELRTITAGPGDDELKVCTLGLLSELGEKAAAVFADPNAIQRRSAIALAAQLATDADVASAADLMVCQLGDDDIVQMLDVMSEAEPVAARRLVTELSVRLDLSGEVRERLLAAQARRDEPATSAVGQSAVIAASTPRRPARVPQVVVLVDASARLVVVASRKVSGERRYRQWAVLIGANGRIEDCLHEDDATVAGEAGPLVTNLCSDGYRIASSELHHARTVVATAAQLTALAPDGLTSSYYLGRDLLELGDAHLSPRDRAPATPALAARAIEQTHEALATGDYARAEAMLALCEPTPDVLAATATLLLAKQPPDPAQAIIALSRAITLEPDWPLHHWNLAAALHLAGDPGGCFHALRRFVATSAAPTGLYADPEQPARVGTAHRLMAELERTARLTGTPLHRRRRRATTKKARARR